MSVKNIFYHHINLGPKIKDNLEHHNFAFNQLKVSQINTYQDLNLSCQTKDNKGKISIFSDGYARNAVNIFSPKGGIEISCPENILSLKSSKIFYTSRDINISSSNVCSIKTKTFKVDSNVTLLKSFENIDISSDCGKVKVSSNHNDKDSITLKSIKGGVEMFANSKIEILSYNNINLSCFGSESQINIGTTNKNTQFINIGNNKSTISINNDVFIKGNIISTDTKIEKITTCLSETSESILLLSKDNVYGSKNMGFVSRNVNKYVGLLFESQKNEFYMSDNLQFSKSSGITSILSFSKLKIGELDINGTTFINKFGNISCNSIKGTNFKLEQNGDTYFNGNIDVNNKFKINAVNGNCLIDGQLTISGININNIYKHQIGNNFYYKTIQSCLDIIQNKISTKNNFELTLYLSPQEYEENIIVHNNFINIDGNRSILQGIININNMKNNLDLDNKNNSFFSDYFFIRNLDINISQQQESIFNFQILPFVHYTISNINIFISNHVDRLFIFDIENGIVLLDNVNVYLYLDFNINYLFKINKIQKLIIKNSSLIGNNLFELKDSDSEIFITNCFIDGNVDSNSNIVLYNNIIKNSDDTKILLNKQNRFI